MMNCKKLWKPLLLVASLSLPLAARADILPDKPVPAAREHVADWHFWAEAGGLATAWAMDTQSTSAAFAVNPYNHEKGGLFDGSRNVPKIMGAWAAVDVGAAVVAYEWKGHVNNRWLHPLWHVPFIVGMTGHMNSAVNNWAIARRHGL